MRRQVLNPEPNKIWTETNAENEIRVNTKTNSYDRLDGIALIDVQIN